MIMNIDERPFKLADNYLPPLYDGEYTVDFTQNISSPESEKLEVNKKFHVTLNTETLPDNEVFNIYPAKNQQGKFATDLPYMIFNNPAYPWGKDLGKDDETQYPIPWLALIVVTENEVANEKDIPYSELENEKADKTFFPYKKNDYSPCRANDNVHLLTVSKEVFKNIIPTKSERVWLTHYKQVDLSASDDTTTQLDGCFSAIIANRFPQYEGGHKLKNSVHLIAADLYDDGIPLYAEYVEMVSLYHWNIYCDDESEDKSFRAYITGLDNNSRSVTDSCLKPHYLRTGEKTYSYYHSPIMSEKNLRAEKLNGEDKYTSDGRLIYNKETGIFDVSYSAAFNLGKLVTLSHIPEAQKITLWRKQQKIKSHLKCLNEEFSINIHELTEVIMKMKEDKLR